MKNYGTYSSQPGEISRNDNQRNPTYMTPPFAGFVYGNKYCALMVMSRGEKSLKFERSLHL